MTTLADLNELRIQNGKTALKSWKASKAKLREAIDNENGLMVANFTNPKGNPVKKATAEKLLKEEIARAAIIPHNKVNVASIAKELGINPKVARAKLRKNKVDRNDIKAIRKALTKK